MSQKIILDKEQALEFVLKNKYRVDEKTKFLSRCIDGRYEKAGNLPALAIPGADAGELALIFATANIFGLEINEKKALRVLLDIVGGVKNFNLHSDHHGDPKTPASGCGHVKQMKLDAKAYNLEKDQIQFLEKSLSELKKQKDNETILHGEHQEGAVIIINGDWSVYPRGIFGTELGKTNAEVFIFHQSLVNERHRILANKLIKETAMRLFPGGDAEYLYEVLSDTTDQHLFETSKRLASGLPIYKVTFADDGQFGLEEMGNV